LPNTCPIKTSLKWGDAFSPLLFNSAVQYVITKVQQGQDDKQCGCYTQLLVYADHVNILGEGKRTGNQNTGNLLVTNMEIILEVKAEETKYIFMPHEHTTRQNYKHKYK
jgi:hypothetical protein